MDKLRKIWERLTAPRTTGKGARQEYMTRVILVILSAALVIITPLFLITWIIGLFGIDAIITALVLCLSCISCLWLVERGYVKLAIHIPFFLFLLVAVYSIYYYGIDITAVVSYVIMILLAAILQGNKAQRVALFIAITTCWIFGYEYGLRNPESYFVFEVVTTSISLVIIYLLLRFFTSQLEQALIQANTYAAELAEHKFILEEQVAARTLEVTQLAKADRAAREELEQVVAKYGAFMQKVARGDLRGRMEITASADLGLLGQYLNEMVASLRELTAQTVTAAQSITDVTSEIMNATNQQNEATQNQASTIKQTTNTLIQIEIIAEDLVVRAKTTSDTTARTQEASQKGLSAVDETKQGMEHIRSSVGDIAETVLDLGERAQRIGEVIATVDKIAAQSNMLALNAAIEAARAGEAGRGFAIVAQEIQTLSEQSQGATAQVRTILREVQEAIKRAVTATEEADHNVAQGEELTQETSAAIMDLRTQIDEAVRVAVQNADSAQRQAERLGQAGTGMERIDEATQKVVSGAQQMKRAAQDLYALAAQMMQLVAQYQV